MINAARVLKRSTTRHTRRIYSRWHSWRNSAVVIDIDNPKLGFFAQLEWVLELLCHASDLSLPAAIRCVSSNYVTAERGADFLDYFFERRSAGQRTKACRRVRLSDIGDYPLARHYDKELTLQRAHEVFTGAFRVRECIWNDLLTEFDAKRGSHSVLGVHFRGTDKKQEAARLPMEKLCEAIDYELDRREHGCRLFLATDEQQVVNIVRSRYGARVFFLDDRYRSHGQEPVHRAAANDGFALGLDALNNCLALTQCECVIKSASILSSWAAVFSPGLDIFALSKNPTDLLWFPERAIPMHPTCSA